MSEKNEEHSSRRVIRKSMNSISGNASVSRNTCILLQNKESMESTVAQTISFYGYLITSPLGFVGHACSLITFLSETLRTTSTGQLFIFLTLSDTFYLLMGIYDFIALILRIPTFPSLHLCRFRIFTLYFLTATSAWILVLIAMDRCIRARFPFQQALVCTRKVAVVATCIVCVCSGAFTCHLLQPEVSFIIPGTNICQPPRFPATPYSIFFFNIWPILQIIFTYFISSCLMIACVVGLYDKIRRQQQHLARRSNGRERLQRQMLILMLSSIAWFIVCTWPFSILVVVSSRLGTPSPTSVETSIAAQFLNMNYCYNFYIHCLTSRLFRATFKGQCKRFFTWCKRSCNHTVHPLSTTDNALA